MTRGRRGTAGGPGTAAVTVPLAALSGSWTPSQSTDLGPPAGRRRSGGGDTPALPGPAAYPSGPGPGGVMVVPPARPVWSVLSDPSRGRSRRITEAATPGTSRLIDITAGVPNPCKNLPNGVKATWCASVVGSGLTGRRRPGTTRASITGGQPDSEAVSEPPSPVLRVGHGVTDRPGAAIIRVSGYPARAPPGPKVTPARSQSHYQSPGPGGSARPTVLQRGPRCAVNLKEKNTCLFISLLLNN